MKKLDGKYRLARILANGTREIYPPWWWEEEKRKENGEGEGGPTKLVRALSESESHVERTVCDYTS